MKRQWGQRRRIIIANIQPRPPTRKLPRLPRRLVSQHPPPHFPHPSRPQSIQPLSKKIVPPAAAQRRVARSPNHHVPSRRHPLHPRLIPKLRTQHLQRHSRRHRLHRRRRDKTLTRTALYHGTVRGRQRSHIKPQRASPHPRSRRQRRYRPAHRADIQRCLIRRRRAPRP